MCAILRQRGKQRRDSSDSLDTASSSEEPQVASVKVGHLTGVMQELKGLLHDILRKEAKGTCPSCGADVNDRMKLEIQLHKTQENFEKLERDLKKKEEESLLKVLVENMQKLATDFQGLKTDMSEMKSKNGTQDTKQRNFVHRMTQN